MQPMSAVIAEYDGALGHAATQLVAQRKIADHTGQHDEGQNDDGHADQKGRNGQTDGKTCEPHQDARERDTGAGRTLRAGCERTVIDELTIGGHIDNRRMKVFHGFECGTTHLNGQAPADELRVMRWHSKNLARCHCHNSFIGVSLACPHSRDKRHALNREEV